MTFSYKQPSTQLWTWAEGIRQEIRIQEHHIKAMNSWFSFHGVEWEVNTEWIDENTNTL